MNDKKIIENLKHNLQFTNNVKKELRAKNIELQKENLKQKEELYYLKKYDLKIFTDDIEDKARKQVYTIVEQEPFKNCKVRIMPDVHAGKGCVIGFTADLGDKVIPNIVGVDIGCGMLCVELGRIDIDLQKFDEIVNKYIPSGRNINEHKLFDYEDINDLYCFRELKDTEKFNRAIGTLGGGNHFIELDKDDEENVYLVIHTGSRNMGKQVADYYQNLAIDLCSGKEEYFKEKQNIINTYKEQGRKSEIQNALKELYKKYEYNKPELPQELCYLEGIYRQKYLHDMNICQNYASINRRMIAGNILNKYFEAKETKYMDWFETIHNYISFEDNIVRKGAIKANQGEKVIIPMNMRDGSLICIGKGNADWNNSAPHGAGRIMSRIKAKETYSLDEFKKSMKGIYSTSVSEGTIDEAPFVYKPMQEIISNIQDTVEVQKIIKPIYNFKANI